MKPPFPAGQGLDFTSNGPVGVLSHMRHATTPELVRAHYDEAKRQALIETLKGDDRRQWRDEIRWIKDHFEEELKR